MNSCLQARHLESPICGIGDDNSPATLIFFVFYDLNRGEVNVLRRISTIGRTLLFACVVVSVLTGINLAAPAPDGQQLYMNHCSGCHALGSVDTDGYAGDIGGMPVSRVKTSVRGGGDGMPAIGSEKLSDAELDVLANYVHSGYSEPAATPASTQTPAITPVSTKETGTPVMTTTPVETPARAQEQETRGGGQATPGFAGILAILSLSAAALLLRK